MADDTGNQDLPCRQFDVFPHSPLILVARVRGFNGIALNLDFQDEVHNVSKGDIVLMGAVKLPQQHVQAHASGGDAPQRMVERFDAQLGELPYSGTLICG